MKFDQILKCQLCDEPMPKGEEMFKYHGYSGPCPKPPNPKYLQCPTCGAGDLYSPELLSKLCPDPWHIRHTPLGEIVSRLKRRAWVDGLCVDPDTDELADDLSQAVKLLFKFVEQISGCDCSICHEAVGNLRKFVGLS